MDLAKEKPVSAPQVVVELDAEGAEGHGQQVVGADGEHEVHQLLVVELGGEHRPGGVGDPGVGDQLVDGAHQGGVERRPARRRRARRRSASISSAAMPGVGGQHDVLAHS